MGSLTAYVTDVGQYVITQLMTTNAKLNIVRAEIGDGSVASETEARALTSLVNKISDAKISGKRLVDGWHIITVEVDNVNLTTELNVREVALYCADPANENKDLLFYYATFGDHPDWIAPNTLAQYTRMYDLGLSFDLVNEVNVKISPDALVTRKDLEALIEQGTDVKAHTHGNISNDGKIGEEADLPIFTLADGKLGTVTVLQARKKLGLEIETEISEGSNKIPTSAMVAKYVADQINNIINYEEVSF